MALPHAPNRPIRQEIFVDPRTGRLSEFGYQVVDQLWRQVAAGFVVVPCSASGTNAITLTPALHKEGAAALTTGMAFSFAAAATSTGPVTIKIGNFDFLKGYKTSGAVQAGSGDVVDASFYLALYVAALDSGAGGFVLLGI